MNSRLREFFATHSNVEDDPREVAEELRKGIPVGYPAWLEIELANAIRKGELSRDEMTDVTDILFSSVADFHEWLREIWALWFPGRPYPTD